MSFRKIEIGLEKNQKQFSLLDLIVELEADPERAKWALVIFLTCQVCDLRLACLKVIGACLQTMRARAYIKLLTF